MAGDQNKIAKQKKLNTRLWEAVSKKDLGKVKKLLENEAHPDTQCQTNLLSCAHLAAYQGSVDILKELLNKGADLTKRDKRGLQPHHLAAFGNASLPCLRMILDKQNGLIDSPVKLDNTEKPLPDEVKINSYFHNNNYLTNLIHEEIKEGDTVLYIATKKGHTKVVKELLERNATVTEEILDLAGNHDEISIMLNTAYKNLPKMGELQMAVFKGNVEDVTQCLQNIEREDQIDPKLLHLAIQNKLKNESNKDDYNDILEKLLDIDGVNINYRDENNKTPLYLATEGKWMDDVDSLIRKNADVNKKCQNGETVFHVAARNKDCNILTYLLNTKPESKALQIPDDEGYTPLYRAIKSGCADCVQALLETAHSDDYKLTIQDCEMTILHAAIESSRNRDMILLKILEFLVKKNSPESVSVLNERNSEGLTAVDLAAERGEIKCLDVLFKYDDIIVIPTNINKKEYYGTALHYAAKKGYFVCMERILDQCEEIIDMSDSRGLTALIYAARGGYSKCVKLLLKRGANLAVKDPSANQTAIDIIMSNIPGAVEIIDEVLDSFILPNKNVDDTKEPVIDKNINKKKEENLNQEEISLLNSIKNSGHNEVHNHNPSVSIELSTSDSSAAEDHVQNNSIAPEKHDNETNIITKLFLKKKARNNNHFIKHKENPLTKNNENYKINKIHLDYKCLVAGSRELEVIEAVNECKYDKLKHKFFLHPLVKTFLIYKWKKIKNLHLLLFFVYLTQTLSVTGLAMFTWHWTDLFSYLICMTLIILTMIPIILVEFIKCVQDLKIYSRFETYIKLFGLLLIGLHCMITSYSYLLHPGIGRILSYFGSVAVLFSWMNLLLFFSMRCNGGFFIVLFFKIAKNVFQVLSLFLFLIFGFALSFFILFSGRKPFRDLFSSLGQVVAMISEMKYNEVFEAQTDSLLIALGYVLFIVFYVLVVMVMMNLILGLSVNIVTEHQGKCKHLALQSTFLSLVDKFCWDEESNKLRDYIKRFPYSWIKKQLKEKEKINFLNIFPNQPTKDQIFEKALIFEVMEIVNNKCKQYRPQLMAQKMEKVGERLDQVLEMVNSKT